MKHVQTNLALPGRKKRRIALLAALAAQAVPDETVSLVLNGIAILLGGTDLAQTRKRKLPNGIK